MPALQEGRSPFPGTGGEGVDSRTTTAEKKTKTQKTGAAAHLRSASVNNAVVTTYQRVTEAAQ